MLDQSFKVAMHNAIAMAGYFTPHNILNSGHEWLIVERSGSEGDILTISDAGGATSVPPTDAPASLSENNSMYGILLYEEEREAVFLLVRHLPAGGIVPGSFFPADGCAILTEECNGFFMRASGRHAHDATGNDIPNPPVGGPGFAWHFDAKRVNWVNQNFTSSVSFFSCIWRWIWPWWYCRRRWPFFRVIAKLPTVKSTDFTSIWPKP